MQQTGTPRSRNLPKLSISVRKASKTLDSKIPTRYLSQGLLYYISVYETKAHKSMFSAVDVCTKLDAGLSAREDLGRPLHQIKNRFHVLSSRAVGSQRILVKL